MTDPELRINSRKQDQTLCVVVDCTRRAYATIELNGQKLQVCAEHFVKNLEQVPQKKEDT